MLAHVPSVENPGADWGSRLENQPEDRIHLKLTISIPVFQAESDIASETPEQEEDETDYYPNGEVDENIRKHWTDTPENEPTGQTEQEQQTPSENEAHQMTAHGGTRRRQTSVKD